MRILNDYGYILSSQIHYQLVDYTQLDKNIFCIYLNFKEKIMARELNIALSYLNDT